jgi:hypothetical protein
MRRSPEQLICQAIDLLHKARFMLDQAGEGNAVADVERALSATTFARAAVVQAEKIAPWIRKPKRPR